MFQRITIALRRALGITQRQERRERALLTQMCFGDEAAVERLIALEVSQSPGISEAAACRRAIRRMKRDNR